MSQRGGRAGPRGPERQDIHPAEPTEDILGQGTESLRGLGCWEAGKYSTESNVSQGFGYSL